MTYGLYRTESRGLRMLRWTAAAVFIAVLHVGAALALMQWRDEESYDDSLGSIALDLAPEQTFAPQMQEGASPQEEAKQVKEVAEETPVVAPSPLAPKPEVQVPVRDEEKEKPKEENPAITSKAVPEIPGDPISTAPPPSEAKLSPIPTAPAAGISEIAAKAEARWRNELVSHINSKTRYPAAALTHHVHGVVTLEFTVDRAGQVVVSRVIKSSGSALLDDAAMSLLKRASPLPTPPPQDPRAIFDFTLPISFELR